MTIVMYLGIAAALFLIGIIFIVRGLPSEEARAVPISNPKEILELKKSFTPSQPRDLPAQSSPDEAAAGPPQDNDPMAQNHQLRKEILDEKGKNSQLELRLDALQKEYEQAKESHQQALRVMQEENTRHRAEMEQRSVNDGRLDELKAKIGTLEQQYTESQKQQDEMRTAVAQLKTERDDLIAQSRLRQEQADNQSTKRTKEESKAEFELLSNKLIESITAIEGLKRENKNLVQANQDLKEEFAKIKALNDQLMKKEKMMQYELTKNRAQALGLEKICADFRTQIETMAGSATGKA